MIYFLIPAYNESENLVELVKTISSQQIGKKIIIVVDDGSTDESKKILKRLEKKYPLTPLGYKINRGAGYAFKFGLAYLIPKLQKDDVVITMESDNTTDYFILGKMLKKSVGTKVIIASPHAKGGKFIGVGRIRIALSRVAAFTDSIIFGINSITTYSSFYRVYPADLLIRAQKRYGNKFITHFGFSAAVELLIKLKNINAQFLEIGATVDWNKRKGKSKMKIYQNVKNHFVLYRDYLVGKFG